MAEQGQASAEGHLDAASIAVIVITFALFAAALVVKGIGHELLLEGAVFLVSVKLILMAYKGDVANRQLLRELGELRTMVAGLQRQQSDTRPGGAASASR